MWFDAAMHDAYTKGIELAVHDAGYKPLRIDHVEHANKSCDEIVAHIKCARFVIADFTCGVFETTETDVQTGNPVTQSEYILRSG